MVLKLLVLQSELLLQLLVHVRELFLFTADNEQLQLIVIILVLLSGVKLKVLLVLRVSPMVLLSEGVRIQNVLGRLFACRYLVLLYTI